MTVPAGVRVRSYDAAVTRRAPDVRAPRDYIVSGTWPDGELSVEEPAARYASYVAKELAAALEGANKAAVARDARLARTTLYAILDGRTWPDLLSLVRLEHATGRRLWPAKPLT